MLIPEAFNNVNFKKCRTHQPSCQNSFYLRVKHWEVDRHTMLNNGLISMVVVSNESEIRPIPTAGQETARIRKQFTNFH